MAAQGTIDFTVLTEKARRGDLSGDDVSRLRGVAAGARDWKESRAVLLAHYEAAGNPRGHCEIATDVLRVGEAATDPQFNLEMGKCHLREGRYQEALNTARVAELHAQDIPQKVRTDRQLKIWEVQAKAYKGLYQTSENPDYIDDSVSVWKRYKNLAINTYRQREADRAESEIRALQELAAGAL